jgi:hypothetical protein
LQVAPGGGATYYPRAGFVGIDAFTYWAIAPIATPPGYEESNHATVTITVGPASSAPSPSRQRKVRVRREYLTGGRKLVVRRDRVVRYKNVALACGTQDDRACVAYGYLSALRVVGRSELRSPILGRFRLSADAGETVPIRVKLSRFGLRYVKRHDPLETYLVIRYAIKARNREPAPRSARRGAPRSGRSCGSSPDATREAQTCLPAIREVGVSGKASCTTGMDEEHPRRQARILPASCIGTAWAP